MTYANAVTQAYSAALQIHPVAGRIGAEISQLRVSADLDAVTFSAIHSALLKYKVVFLRHQAHLDDASHEAFAARFGELLAQSTAPKLAGTNPLLERDSVHGALDFPWHTDLTFLEAYPKISVSRAVVTPPYGGDTVWANTAAAYQHLPAPLQHLADGLRAVHSNLYDYAGTDPGAAGDGLGPYREAFRSTLYETEHPVVRVHPETGERSLLLGQFVQRLQGLSRQDAHHLLKIFHTHITRTENTVRWNWQVGDLVIWDNRATQHYALNDYDDARRVLRRATVQGEIPLGIDGRPSRALQPTPAAHETRAQALPHRRKSRSSQAPNTAPLPG